MRWLGRREQFVASDMHLYRGVPETEVGDLLIGHRLHQTDVGHFARWLVEPKPLGLLARILQKKNI